MIVMERNVFNSTLGSGKAELSAFTCKSEENLSASTFKADVAYARAMMIFSVLCYSSLPP